MKIYIPCIKLNTINPALLEKYLFKKQNEVYIFSEEGIIQIQGEKLFKINIIDEQICKEIKLDKFDIITDNSKFVIECECVQVYPYHIEEIIHKYIYKLRKDTIIDLIIEKKNDTIIDFYFYLKDNKQFINIKEDILTFLFELNLC
jgi:hypothetical protein